ncbi:hypothetical protein D3C80_1783940 [compost metagenome]
MVLLALVSAHAFGIAVWIQDNQDRRLVVRLVGQNMAVRLFTVYDHRCRELAVDLQGFQGGTDCLDTVGIDHPEGNRGD